MAVIDRDEWLELGEKIHEALVPFLPVKYEADCAYTLDLETKLKGLSAEQIEENRAQAKIKRTELQKATLDAKKKLFETDDGKKLLTKFYDQALQFNFTLYSLNTSGEKKHDVFLKRADELAYISGEPLAAILIKHLKKYGLDEKEIEYFLALTALYKTGADENLLKTYMGEHPMPQRLRLLHREADLNHHSKQNDMSRS